MSSRTDSGRAWPMSGEHFIPFRRTDIITMCGGDLPAEEKGSFVGFTRMLASLLHHRFRDRIEALKDAYHPFNPEADTRTLAALSPADRVAAQQRLEEELTSLAHAANYSPMDVDELQRAAGVHSLLKVRMEINTNVIDKIIFFRRGESIRTRDVPIWYGLRRRSVSFTNYARVLVYAKFKEAEHFAGADLDRLPFRPGSTIVKLFQNVPRDDLEMVFPNVQVRMRLVDKLLIGVPALVSGVVVIVTKLFATFGLLLLLLGFWVGIRHEEVPVSQAALVSAGVGIFAFGGYLVRQVTKFKNRKILFMKALSENLYFRNLDNDAGVFHNLLDAAEEMEVIEAVLAYHFVRTAKMPPTASELDGLVEGWFAGRWDARFDFEVEDGLRKVRELGLVTEDDDGRLHAVTLSEAKQQMDRVWDDVFDYSRPAVAPAQRTV
jgi:Protein of unknown function (DUF3754)